MKEMSQLMCLVGGIACMVAGGALMYDTFEHASDGLARTWFQEGLFWFGIGVFMMGFAVRGGGNNATD